MARDITEGRGDSSGYGRSIAVELGIGTGNIWQNSGDSYDCAIAGIPFLMAINDTHPYERTTAPFRKQQFDSQRDPGEQSLSTWWLRSQSSFHAGEGINFYDPLSNPYSTTLASNSYRYNDSLAVEVFETQGQVTLLKRPAKTQDTTAAKKIMSVVIGGVDKVLILDGAALKTTDGTTAAMTTISAGVATTIYDATNDGTKAYYIDADHIVSVALTGGSTSAVRNVSSVSSATMAYVKQRLVVGINNKIYAIPTTSGGGALPTEVYAHPNTSWVWTSITEGGGAVYAAGYVGSNSCVYKFVLTTAGEMQTLTSAITAVVVPDGEIIHNIFVHLMAYMAIGTNKGLRIGSIDNATGNVTYGPLIIHSDTPIHGFTARDSYIYCGSGLDVSTASANYAGVYKVDLSTEIDTLRFPYSTDIYLEDTVGSVIGLCFLGANTTKLVVIASASTTAVTPTGALGLWVQSATELYPSGWIQTGYVRFNTLEPKNFKRVVGRGTFTYGSLSIQAHSTDNQLWDIITYDSNIGTPEVTISQPVGAQDALGLRFVLTRDATDTTQGPIFKGYQLKAVPASPRSRLIKIPLFCFDTETDKYNSTIGYEGRAYIRLAALEQAEANGDVVTWQDFRTGETKQCLIEEISFLTVTPPDKKLTGFGGIVTITIRTV